MTKFEQAELNELGMTPEDLEQRRREVEAKLHAEPNGIAPTRPRKPRSDRGIAKGPKLVKEPEPARIASLSAGQADLLRELAEKMVASARELADAQRKNVQATIDFHAYLEVLAGKL